MRTRPAEIALVVGAGSGLGRAAALRLAQGGMAVQAADLDFEAAQATARSIAAAGGRAQAFPVDVADPGAVVDLFAGLRRAVPRLDLVVHAAAILGRTVLVEEMTDQDWGKMLAVNLSGPFHVCREAVRWLRETGGGRIILFSSVASLIPTPGAAHYSAAKGGVNLLVKSLAAEAARHNIRVNAIAPGYMDTPMLAGLPDGFADQVIKKTPLKRLGDPAEVAGLAAFLASPEADFITGQVLSPNGGLVM